MLTKEQILKQRAEVTAKTFPSKSLGGKVRFRRMAAAGHYAVESYTTRFFGDGRQPKRDFTYMKQAMIAYSMVDDSDTMLFGPEDIEGVISEFDKDVIDELFGFAVELNPPASVLAKDLEKNPKGSSSTG